MSNIEFPPLKNDLILRVLKGEKVERAPVWCMRQAGRYLPEFRKIRAEQDFFKVCRTPELAAEVTIQPIRRYAGLLDASIIFSDILVIPQAMGMEVLMVPGKGPHFPDPIVTPADIDKLTDSDPDYSADQELKYVYDALTLTRNLLDGAVPLFGFAGSPWTLMAYMIEGGGSKTLAKAKTFLWRHPKASHELLTRITNVAITYLKGQIRAGAQMLQLFDSWAGELSPADYLVFSYPYLKRIAEEVNLAYPSIPLLVFPKGVHQSIIELYATDTKYSAISLDWTTDPRLVISSISEKMERIGKPLILQGNLDPTLLFADVDVIDKRTEDMCHSFSGANHIANLGHGMMPDHDPEHLKAFLQAVHKHSRK
ncbi:Uroporphyrinogen decarboxylase [Smittium mucronatum]|uniref:Uroporphyrinogen decarboxylase n=1 Tax=Smittium mucronatum TaxID=133383 RepID=A0A1R0H7L6_9FUNG|nr:Uroporphyrinogen decarboxylase [Smittium mucronatum]